MYRTIYNNAKKALIENIKEALNQSGGSIEFKTPISNGIYRGHNDSWECFTTHVKFARFSKNLASFEKYNSDDIVYSRSGCYDCRIDDCSVDKLYQLAKACWESSCT